MMLKVHTLTFEHQRDFQPVKELQTILCSFPPTQTFLEKKYLMGTRSFLDYPKSLRGRAVRWRTDWCNTLQLFKSVCRCKLVYVSFHFYLVNDRLEMEPKKRINEKWMVQAFLRVILHLKPFTFIQLLLKQCKLTMHTYKHLQAAAPFRFAHIAEFETLSKFLVYINSFLENVEQVCHLRFRGWLSASLDGLKWWSFALFLLHQLSLCWSITNKWRHF